MTLHDTLAQYYQPEGPLSMALVRDDLLRDLEKHQRQLTRYQNIQMAAIVLLTVMAMAALGVDLVHSKSQRYLVLAGAGVSIPTLLAMLRKTIAEWSRTNMFLILVKSSDEKDARALLRKYAKPATGR